MQPKPSRRGGGASPIRPRRTSDIVARVELYDYVEGYGEIIRKAREDLGLTREELASQLKEKSTLLKKIEREEMRPSIQLARKLEKHLKIRILKELSEGEGSLFQVNKPNTKRATLGDYLIKKEDR